MGRRILRSPLSLLVPGQVSDTHEQWSKGQVSLMSLMKLFHMPKS